MLASTLSTAGAPTAYQYLRAYVLGLLFSSATYGAFITQCLRYRTYFRGKDKTFFRILVPVLVFLNTAYLAVSVGTFLEAIQLSLQPPPFLPLPSTLRWVAGLMLVVTVACTYTFFLYRAYGLYPHWLVPSIGTILVVAAHASYVPFFVYQFKLRTDYSVAPKLRNWQIVCTWLMFSYESYVAVILLLRLRKTGEIKNRPTNDYVFEVLETAMASSAILVPVTLTGAILSSIEGHPGSSINQLAVAELYPAIASLCVVYGLNHRHKLRGRGLGGGNSSNDPASWRGDVSRPQYVASSNFLTTRRSRSLQDRPEELKPSDSRGDASAEEWDDDRVLISADGTVQVQSAV